MFFELVKAIKVAIEFRNITPTSIHKIESNVEFIWFKSGDEIYCIDIKKVEMDLDEYA